MPGLKSRPHSGWVLGPLGLLLFSCSGGPASDAESDGGRGGGANEVATQAAAQVGLMTVRRLNRTEYTNTLRALTGTSSDPGAGFPPENLSFGFDNIGEALTVQPLHVELYEQTADAVLEELFARPTSDPLRARILRCDPNVGGRPCVVHMLLSFAQYAYRRPVLQAEVASLVDLAESFVSTGGAMDEGLKLAFKGILLSPHFLFRVELDPEPTSKVPHRVGPFELASRLSYYLWSSMPDEALFVDAQSGQLLNDAPLASQVERMLSDSRAAALVENFAGQWLNLRRTAQVMPDSAVFPEFDQELQASLRTESELFFAELVENGRPFSELLTAQFSYVNAPLAAHYGLLAPAGPGFERMDLSGTTRAGFLTQASFLTVTSNPTRTSPVKRGKWVLDQLLCAPPPPPPPGVDATLVEGGTLSLRQKLETHRAKEPCKSCHAVMDPIGLAFENFDGVGKYRSEDQYGPIDAAGTLPTPDGDVPFLSASELIPVLAGDRRLADCIAQKVLTYAIGRGFSGADEKTLAAVLAGASASGQGFRGLFASVATSEAFRSRRAVGE